ncbi:beta-1,3-galactosyltransferase 5-like [Mobula hypostoma]|uniref:beta-1,3-galactosyltransferase 5-like n=1 Tax=Mobula hypostoma TaxID=723540 RepID=UPI002FC2E5F8
MKLKIVRLQRRNWFLKFGTPIMFLIISLIVIALLSRDLGRRKAEPRSSSRFYSTSFLMGTSVRCDTKTPFLVLLVTSSPEQLEARSAIRQTWGSEQLVGGARSVTYFLLGNGREWQDRIRREGELHRDIIQGDFEDAYHNLTRKVLMGLEWVCSYCPSASFVMKTDSDVFVNTDYLIELLSRHPTMSNLFTGFIMKHRKPVRDNTSKWYVSEEEYPGDTYPPFCSGTGYVLSIDLACRVWHTSSSAHLLKLEDIHVALRIAEMKVEPVPIISQPVFRSYQVPFSICSYRRLVTSHQATISEQLLYWKALKDSADEKCPGDP